jgi:hypothetical protein
MDEGEEGEGCYIHANGQDSLLLVVECHHFLVRSIKELDTVV